MKVYRVVMCNISRNIAANTPESAISQASTCYGLPITQVYEVKIPKPVAV